jgi:hypothetical protein
MSTTLRLCLAIGLATFPLLGSTASAQDKAAKVSPSELFTPEQLRRLAPHLEFAGHGCVKLTFDGERKLSVKLREWKNGKFTARVDVEISSVKAGEVSISIREAFDSKGKMKYKFVVATPFGSQSGWIDIPAGMQIKSSKGLHKEVVVQDGTAVAVWALVAQKKGPFKSSSAESVEQMVKRMDWALVLSITLAKKK